MATVSFANLGIGAWAAVWIAVAGVVAYRARRGDRHRAAAWMITVAAFLAVQEDPALCIWYASVPPSVDPDGVLGVVHAHSRGHMLGSGVFAVAGLAVAVWVAHVALRRGERWAWRALLAYLLLGAAVDIAQVLFIYPHGFPVGATPADGVRGFGWPQIAAWIAIWSFALWFSRGEAVTRAGRKPSLTHRSTPENG
ncbi:hypothetical protein GCM10009557_25810 [Virgisporangium ochraceum]|uniref:Uncharacterized protein n=1 Tax=Virgisporangium ochraceum TaxID=65505 RepID=A0A8J3ZZG8_9ACTN|nr:hypothetical protein Voc01_078190 [Virgisporangium ochraceum]